MEYLVYLNSNMIILKAPILIVPVPTITVFKFQYDNTLSLFLQNY